MSHTGRAIYRAMYEPENLTDAEREFASVKRTQPGVPTPDPSAPTDREWREHRDANTVSAAEWGRYARN